jgi:hypothetical protein
MSEPTLAPEAGFGRDDTVSRETAAPVLTAEESRQGVTSGRVRLVLFFSTMLALLALGAVYVAYA